MRVPQTVRNICVFPKLGSLTLQITPNDTNDITPVWAGVWMQCVLSGKPEGLWRKHRLLFSDQ